MSLLRNDWRWGLATAVMCVGMALLATACGSESDARGTETRCDDRKDGDRDGLFDCNDPDCASLAICVREHCYNLVDDDGDGAVDCADDQCDGRSVCSGAAEDCVNERDDDGDGLIDCADDGCSKTAACAPDGEDCTNGRDDDGDAAADCDDADCAGTAVCALSLEACGDGVDNDEDGAIDCDDDDCARTSECLDTGELCANGEDDDGDARVDCDDTDCAYTDWCAVAVEVCDNGLDDDGDGQADCRDDDCASTTACQQFCTADTDMDGTPDCDDDDIDGDGTSNASDVCPSIADPAQLDSDDDGIGDACDDGDRDGIASLDDNCPTIRNTDQLDRDGDGVGNACDSAEDIDDADVIIARDPALQGPARLAAVGDATGDGRPDLLYTHIFDNVIWVIGDVLGRRGETIRLADVSIRRDFAFEVPVVTGGDIDGDGVLDIVYASKRANGDHEVVVLLGPIDGGTDLARDRASRSIVFPNPDDINLRLDILVADANVDGRDDILIGAPESRRGKGDVYAFDSALFTAGIPDDLAPGDASWTLGGELPGAGFGASVQLMDDFDADGFPDLAIADKTNAAEANLYLLSSSSVLLGDEFALATWSQVSAAQGDFRLEIIPDIDGDGRTDLHYRGGTCGTQTDRGHAVFPLAANSPPRVWGSLLNFFVCNETAPFSFGLGAHFVDVDGDGLGEFLAPVEESAGNAVYYYSDWQAASADPSTPLKRINMVASPGNIEVRPIGDVDGNGTVDTVITDGFGSSNTEDQRIWLWP